MQKTLFPATVSAGWAGAECRRCSSSPSRSLIPPPRYIDPEMLVGILWAHAAESDHLEHVRARAGVVPHRRRALRQRASSEGHARTCHRRTLPAGGHRPAWRCAAATSPITEPLSVAGLRYAVTATHLGAGPGLLTSTAPVQQSSIGENAPQGDGIEIRIPATGRSLR